MAQFFQSVGDVLSTLGSSFCVPVMLFIIALFMGCKGQKAFRAALLCAAGLTGFSLVINSYSGIIAPVCKPGDLIVMCNHYHRLVKLITGPFDQSHNICTGFRVEVPCRFIGKHNRRFCN